MGKVTSWWVASGWRTWGWRTLLRVLQVAAMWENHLYTLLNNCWTLCGLRKVYQRELCVREPRCVLCINAQECKMKGCHYVANLAYGVQFSSLYLTVLSLEVIHIYAYKMLIYLLIVWQKVLCQEPSPRFASPAKATRSLWFHFPFLPLLHFLFLFFCFSWCGHAGLWA